MLEIGNIAFKWGFLLPLLLLVPALWYWRYKRQREHYAEMLFPTLDNFPEEKSLRTAWQPSLFLLRLAAMVCLIIAIARPMTLTEEQKIKAEGIDIMMAMDVSSSMLAKDFEPDRLDAAKDVAARFVDKRAHDRIGLVVFSGESYTQCPLTTDRTIVKQFLSQLQCGLIADGTAIGMGLANAVKRLADSDAKSKVVILLTDGVNNAGYTSPMQAADAAKKLGIRVYTIGVGTKGRAKAPIARSTNGSYVFGWTEVEIDEPLMQRISEETGGQYFRAVDMESLERVYEQIDQLEKVEIESTSIRHEQERFRPFLLAAFALIALELLLQYTVFRTILQ